MAIGKLTSLAVIGANALELAWDDGHVGKVELANVINSHSGLKSIRAVKAFSKAALSRDRWSVEWPGGIDFGSPQLRRWADEQSGEAMPPADFREWMETHGLTLDSAASALGLSRRMIAYYASGEKEIPKTVLLATEGYRARERAGRKRVGVAEEGARFRGKGGKRSRRSSAAVVSRKKIDSQERIKTKQGQAREAQSSEANISNESELRHRLRLLQNHLREGRFSFAEHLADQTEASLLAVRYGPDGEADLSTVDSRVRSLAMMSAVVDHRDQAKGIATLREVQQAYFSMVEREFGPLFKQAQKQGYNVHTASLALSRDSEFVRGIDPQIDGFLEEVQKFWSELHETVTAHVQDLKSLKGVFGGELFPHWSKNVASTTGLYLDTVVLQCPFLHSVPMFKMWPPEERVRYLYRHAFTLLQSYRDLALAEIDPPIVVILPFRVSIEDEQQERDFLSAVTVADALKHLEYITRIRFSSLEEADEYLRKFADVAALVDWLPNKDRLLFDAEWKESLPEQFAKEAEVLQVRLDHIPPGSLVVMKAHNRMMQATDILMRSRLLGGTPLIGAETSWRYLQWKLEYSADDEWRRNVDLHVVRGLQGLSGSDVEWLGEIPPSALIEMRRTGAMAEIRQTLSTGIGAVAEASGNSFYRTRDRIWDNIQDAFKKHQENIQELRRKQFKFFGQDLGAWLVSGTIEIAAVANGLAIYGLSAFALSQVSEAPKLKDLPKKLRELKNADRELKKSPMGLFFKHKTD